MSDDPLELYQTKGYAIKLDGETESRWKARDAALTTTAWNGDIPPIDTTDSDEEDWWHDAVVASTEAVEELIVECLLGEATQGQSHE